MHPTDRAALKRALAAYRAISTWTAAEVATIQLQHGQQAAAIHAAERMQRINLGLKPYELAPCQLHEQRIGGLTRIWPVDPRDRDQRRPEMVMILLQLQRLDLSRFEPNPIAAIELERARRRAPSTGDAA